MQDRNSRLAGALWLLAGLFYLAAETVAAGAFPGYSYCANYVSDLGVPYPGVAEGRMLASGLAWVMNLGLITDGVLFALAGRIACAADLSRTSVRAFLILAAAHGLGTVLVGMVHAGPREVMDGTHALHVLGAALAIIGGNLALMAATGCSGAWGLPKVHRAASLVLGLMGLAGLALLEWGDLTGRPLLATGTAERLSIYPITAWEIGTGLMLLFARAFPQANRQKH